MSEARTLSYALKTGKRLPRCRVGAVADIAAALDETDTIRAAAAKLGISPDALQKFRDLHADVNALEPLQQRGLRAERKAPVTIDDAEVVVQISQLLGIAAQLANEHELGEETFLELAQALYGRAGE